SLRQARNGGTLLARGGGDDGEPAQAVGEDAAAPFLPRLLFAAVHWSLRHAACTGAARWASITSTTLDASRRMPARSAASTPLAIATRRRTSVSTLLAKQTARSCPAFWVSSQRWPGTSSNGAPERPV